MRIDHEKLRADLTEAKKIADKKVARVRDGGSVNSDRVVLCDVRFTKKLEATIRSAGLSCYKGRWGIHLGTGFGGQAARHALGTKAFYEELKKRGYDVTVYYQMD